MTDQNNSALDPVTRRRLLRGTAGSIVAVSFAGCGGNPDEGTPTEGGDGGDGGGDGGGNGDGGGDGGDGGDTPTDSGDGMSGGTLRFSQAKSPIEFDPIVLNDVPSAEIAGLVFDPLYDYSEGTDLVPQIAAEMPTVERDAQRWIVPLDSDATFQNGNQVTAEDVKHSFVAPVAENTENAGEFNMIDEVTVVDEQTVQFDLQFPFGAFEQYITWEIVPKDVRTDMVSYGTDDEDNTIVEENNFAQDPVGAGPFEFVEWEEGNYTRLRRWDDYWDDPVPNLQEIEFRPVEEPTTRVTTLRNGENDVIKTIPPDSYPTVENMNNASIAEEAAVSYFYLAFNCNEGPTADPEVREAVDYVFSMDNAVERFVEPSGVRQYSPMPQVLVEDWDFPIDRWQNRINERDIDQAQSMLDANDNVPDDWSPTIIVPPDDKREQIGVSVSNGLGEAGYDASVQRLDWGPFLDRYVTGDSSEYDMFTLGWAGSPDPDTFMYFLFSHEQIGTTNGTYFENEEMNQAIMTGRQSNDREARREAYITAIDIIMEQKPHIPSYNLKNSFGVADRVNDFATHSVDQFSIVSDYNNVSVQ